ncbi:J domain-containing protein [Halorientalis salina]|uniref:J domain-containing protein n=1 Tax=Halorientalis salina TaxID=2932266 RepID=UPI0010AC57C6|nr:DnaJ domain-containing protein [Halorientalis salina]
MTDSENAAHRNTPLTSMPETFYDTLGVGEDATTEEIRSAYRAKVKETHPDVSNAPDAQQRFKRVKRAKEVLTDAEERDRYDRLGHQQYVSIADGVVDGSQYTAEKESPRNGTETGTSRSGSGNRSDRGDRATSDPFGWSDGDDTGAGSEQTADGQSGGSGDWTDEDSGTADWQQGTGGRQATGSSGYATRTTYGDQSFDRVRVPLTPATLIQIGAMFVLYPVFLVASVFPLFPTVVNVLVGICTLFVVAYLLSIPEVAIVVFGAWSLLTPLLFLSLPGLALVSLWGIAALVATWFPFGLALLTQHALRT